MENIENQTYSNYFNVKELPQFIMFGVWINIAGILSVLSFFSIFFKCLEGFTKKLRNPTLEVAFGAMLRKDDDEFKVCGEEVSPIYAHQLYGMVLTLFGVSLMQFWDDFLIEESRTCSTDPQLACFPVFPEMNTSRLNCSDTSYLIGNNITSVICYRFVFKIGSATTSALGIVTISGLAMYILNLFFLNISKKVTSRKNAFLVSSFVGWIMAAFIAVISYFQFNTSPTAADRATELIKNIYVGSTLLSGILYNPWTGLKVDYLLEKARKFKKIYDALLGMPVELPMNYDRY